MYIYINLKVLNFTKVFSLEQEAELFSMSHLLVIVLPSADWKTTQ